VNSRWSQMDLGVAVWYSLKFIIPLS
jgi:hypothetical protein